MIERSPAMKTTPIADTPSAAPKQTRVQRAFASIVARLSATHARIVRSVNESAYKKEQRLLAASGCAHDAFPQEQFLRPSLSTRRDPAHELDDCNDEQEPGPEFVKTPLVVVLCVAAFIAGFLIG
jgi:hypothetical protein